MFALALWDRTTSTLTLARDRLGEKPLYFGKIGRTFAFASELKSIMGLDRFDAEVDPVALHQLLTRGYVPDPLAIFAGIRKLEPGSLLTLSAASSEPVSRVYWSARDVLSRAQTFEPVSADPEQAASQLEALLSGAVKDQMIADVPVGAFLSGGVDSSLIVALMQRQSSSRVRTFTVAFNEREYDESPHALAVAQHLGTEHTELRVSAADALREIPALAGIYDEPMADSSQLPTLLLSRLTRQHVTVSLSGDGGDELFGGYNRHLWGARVWKRLEGKPHFLRSVLAGALGSRPASALLSAARPLLPARYQYSSPVEKLQKLAFAMSAIDQESFFDGLATRWPGAEQLVQGLPSREVRAAITEDCRSPDEWMMLRDLVTYLPGDVLVKVDRAAMSASLETRTPYLDHRVVEFALRLPVQMKIREGQGKWLLRRVLYRHVPRDLIERPKMGFAVPLRHWLRGELRDWAENLLAPARLRSEGYLDPKPIQQAWREHLGGQRDHSEKLWVILTFQAWLDRWMSERRRMLGVA
jgi:asparagine synthase (glutamine-hydrolysing)